MLGDKKVEEEEVVSYNKGVYANICEVLSPHTSIPYE